mmetsp:Transcript_234/g.584  ORF Transcript_234/g.584 Transcript_234/m.584 type:complete len:83 (-) Transcript_234:2045-2293(-)
MSPSHLVLFCLLHKRSSKPIIWVGSHRTCKLLKPPSREIAREFVRCKDSLQRAAWRFHDMRSVIRKRTLRYLPTQSRMQAIK